MKPIKSTKEIFESSIPDYINTITEKTKYIEGIICPYCQKEMHIHRDNFKNNKRFTECLHCKKDIHLEYSLILEQTLEIKIRKVTIEQTPPQSIEYLLEEEKKVIPKITEEDIPF